MIRGQQPPQWYLYIDHCMDDRYSVAVLPDLLSWRVVDGVRFPSNARHGSICPVAEKELDVLVLAYAGGRGSRR